MTSSRRVLRRIRPDGVIAEEGVVRLKSSEFSPSSLDRRMSTDAEWVLEDEGKPYATCLGGYPTMGLVAIPVEVLSGLGLEYEVDADPTPWHTSVWVEDASGVTKKDFSRSTKRELAKSAEWVLPIPDASPLE